MSSGINASGQAVGWFWAPGTVRHACLYSNGARTDLGTLGGSKLRLGHQCQRAGGGLGLDYQPAADYAFLYSNGTMTDLGTLGGGIKWRPTASMTAGRWWAGLVRHRST